MKLRVQGPRVLIAASNGERARACADALGLAHSGWCYVWDEKSLLGLGPDDCRVILEDSWLQHAHANDIACAIRALNLRTVSVK